MVETFPHPIIRFSTAMAPVVAEIMEAVRADQWCHVHYVSLGEKGDDKDIEFAHALERNCHSLQIICWVGWSDGDTRAFVDALFTYDIPGGGGTTIRFATEAGTKRWKVAYEVKKWHRLAVKTATAAGLSTEMPKEDISNDLALFMMRLAAGQILADGPPADQLG